MKTTATAASFLRTAKPVLINSPKRCRSCQMPPPIEISPTLTPMSASNMSNRFAIGGSRRRVVFGVLVVVILGQRSVDEIQNHSRNVDLPAIEKLERFLGQTSRGVGEPDNKERGVDFRGETRGIVRRQNGRTVDDDVIVVLINFFQERLSRLAQEMFARLGQRLATR